MFAFDRSAFAVLVPLAVLFAVVLWSNDTTTPAVTQQAENGDREKNQTVAANLPSR
jgi:hypothetical protein